MAAYLGEFEQLILLAILRLGPKATGSAIRGAVEEGGRRTVWIGAVHTTLERLEQKGLARSRIGDPTPQRGGKRKRHYEVSASGRRARQAAYRSIRSMAEGIEGLLGEPA